LSEEANDCKPVKRHSVLSPFSCPDLLGSRFASGCCSQTQAVPFSGGPARIFPSGFRVKPKILPGEPKPRGRASETQSKRARSRTAAVCRAQEFSPSPARRSEAETEITA